MAGEAEKAGLEVKKALHAMQKKLQQMEKRGSGGSELADFEALEQLLEGLRLACMATTFTDLRFAHENAVEDKLWNTHVSINNEYRKTISRLKTSGEVVLLRNIEKQYAKHLKTAQYFYKGFIERLSARYRLPQLQRIAQRTKSASIKVDDVIDARSAHVDSQVTISCHRTLLHLGDLSRYRMKQSRQKGHGIEAAIVYYSLAHDIMPMVGDAHHQMGVVLADEKRDFDIVYHFYRAWAVSESHPNVPKNLASEFKSLLNSSSLKGVNATIDPQQTFALWFVRLHARFFMGEAFSQQEELEQEVLHRFEKLVSTSGCLAMLQKAILINICAYYVALKKAQKQWTLSASQSCQFILRFNTRTILSVALAVEKEIQSVVDQSRSGEQVTNADGGGKSKKLPANLGAAFDTSLPLLRISMAWLLACHKDIVDFKQYLDPFVTSMHRTLTRCLSLFVEIISGTEVTPSSYLLPEDVETVGVISLDNWNALRSSPNGSLKPRYDEPGIQQDTPEVEMLARVYDILECGVALVSTENFPWKASSVRVGSGDMPGISYIDDIQLSASAPVTEASSLPQAQLATVDAPDHAIHSNRIRPETRQPPKPSEVVGRADVNLQAVPLDTDLNVDIETYSRVQNFLAPPESRETGTGKADESSYGMHSSTADEIFGQIQPRSPVASSPTAPSSAAKTFPSLPWDLVFTPKPNPGMAAEAGSRFTHRSTNSGDKLLPRVPDESWAFGSADANSSPKLGTGTNHEAASTSQRSPRPPGLPLTGFPSASQPVGSGNPWAAPQSGSGTAFGYGMGTPAFYSTNFSQNSTSSLPPVHSPRGLPVLQQTRPGGWDDSFGQASPQVSPSTARFDNARGNWQSASTAWGRGDVVSKDDPTHFRNTVKSTSLMDDTVAYDRNALFSALNEEKKSPR